MDVGYGCGLTVTGYTFSQKSLKSDSMDVVVWEDINIFQDFIFIRVTVNR